MRRFNKFTKVLFTLALILSLASVSNNYVYSASNVDDSGTFELSLSSDTTVGVNIPTEYQLLLSEQDLLDIAIRDNLQDGEVITIHEINEVVENEENMAPLWLFTYKTYITNVGSEWAAQNYFVISVARGQTTTLSTAFSQTLTLGITSGTPYVEAQIGSSVTSSYSITYQFVGPPENSLYNSREFRVQFYAQTANWIQDKYLFNIFQSSTSGSANIPTRYVAYSIDRQF